MFDQLYENVRDLGLPYKISESGGSVIIKISSNIKQSQQLQQKKEKFRFNSVRTINGSDNLNWRAPQTYNEDFLTSRTPFPDISFFRNTPPPDLTTASPCPVPLCSTSPCQAHPRTAPLLSTAPSPHASACSSTCSYNSLPWANFNIIIRLI